MLGSSKWWGLNSTQIHGTHVPVEEPSTASIGDIAPAIWLGTKSEVKLPRRRGRLVAIAGMES
jgi:hypothetical protein